MILPTIETEFLLSPVHQTSSLLSYTRRDVSLSTRQTLSTSPKLTSLRVYDNRDGVSENTTSPSSPSSLTDVHRYIGSRNATRQTLSTSVKLTHPSVYDNRDGVSERAGPRRPPPRSHMYTGTSVLVTQPVRLYLPL
jgi:hypothetical protein